MNVEIFCACEVRPEVTTILLTRDNILLHRKRIYLQKNEGSIFKHNDKVFRNSPRFRHSQFFMFAFLGHNSPIKKDAYENTLQQGTIYEHTSECIIYDLSILDFRYSLCFNINYVVSRNRLIIFYVGDAKYRGFVPKSFFLGFYARQIF